MAVPRLQAFDQARYSAQHLVPRRHYSPLPPASCTQHIMSRPSNPRSKLTQERVHQRSMHMRLQAVSSRPCTPNSQVHKYTRAPEQPLPYRYPLRPRQHTCPPVAFRLQGARWGFRQLETCWSLLWAHLRRQPAEAGP